MQRQQILVTGGAGFIGTNMCERLLRDGHEVIVLDNLSRPGSEQNVAWLQARHALTFLQIDVRDAAAVRDIFHRFPDLSAVIHLAAQVAATTSITNPREDFEINALGTFNVLEGVRLGPANPMLLYSSTNKVYGGMEAIQVIETDTRYLAPDYARGIPEDYPLDFHSPYGCSKGAADQYVRDYARIYGLQTVIFRQSTVYGPHQFGIEDQGWMAWFVIAALREHPITVYGNGKQVRDPVYVEDLADAYVRAIERRDAVAGHIFNIGGGPDNCLSIWHEFYPLLREIHPTPLAVSYGEWRAGDQPYYVSDITRLREELDWEPQVGLAEGLRRLYRWAADHCGAVALT